MRRFLYWIGLFFIGLLILMPEISATPQDPPGQQGPTTPQVSASDKGSANPQAPANDQGSGGKDSYREGRLEQGRIIETECEPLHFSEARTVSVPDPKSGSGEWKYMFVEAHTTYYCPPGSGPLPNNPHGSYCGVSIYGESQGCPAPAIRVPEGEEGEADEQEDGQARGRPSAAKIREAEPNEEDVAKAQTVNDLIAQEMEDKNLPGVVVGVWIPDEGTYVTAQGTADLDTGRAREPEDPFRIGSITNAFTGTAILQLVEQGKLSKSDPLSTWYPDFPNADEITVDDLLMMRSGITDPFDKAFLKSWYDNPEENITPEESIAAAAARADDFEPPDQKTEYNDLNFVLLGEIVKKVSGNDLGTQITQGIFEPLGMENSRYPTNDQLPGKLRGYALDPESEEFEDKTILNPAVLGGAGAIISDLSDLRTYAKALCTGKLLQPETQSARVEGEQVDGEPEFIEYGEGIVLLGKFCGHSGTIFGFSTEMFYLPEEDAVIVVNVNRLDMDDESTSNDLLLAVMKTFFPEYVDW